MYVFEARRQESFPWSLHVVGTVVAACLLESDGGLDGSCTNRMHLVSARMQVRMCARVLTCWRGDG